MGYQIKYASFGEERKQPRKPNFHAIGAAVLTIALVLGAISMKVNTLDWIQNYLMPGDPAVTAAALEDMVKDIKNGDSIADAVTAFCQTIVTHADEK